VDPNLKFLEEIYPALCSWNSWWFQDPDFSGLPQYHHPYSSGLDDNPLWDNPFPVTSPDLITYLVLQMHSLSEIARLLGKPDHVGKWKEKALSLSELMVRELYDPEKGYFIARHGKRVIDECTPFNFIPLWTNTLPDDIKQQLIKTLKQGDLFWKNHPLQTVSSLSPNYDPETMWRGPVWININYLFVEAFQGIGETQLALDLARSTLDLVNSNLGIYEYYNPETGLPPQGAAPIFSWSAALFIDLVLKYSK
jgi:glycogen debranching enzyme